MERRVFAQPVPALMICELLGVPYADLPEARGGADRRDDPDIAGTAVEELMRYLSIAHTGTRVALENVELDGHLVKASETVVVSVQAANRDPVKFPTPDTLDLRRHATGHVSFGHGIHQFLGQQLARIEMRVAFPALVNRFPALALAIPAEKVPLRGGLDIYGPLRLPVTW